MSGTEMSFKQASDAARDAWDAWVQTGLEVAAEIRHLDWNDPKAVAGRTAVRAAYDAAITASAYAEAVWAKDAR